jgi:hypothetical protein
VKTRAETDERFDRFDNACISDFGPSFPYPASWFSPTIAPIAVWSKLTIGNDYNGV